MDGGGGREDGRRRGEANGRMGREGRWKDEEVRKMEGRGGREEGRRAREGRQKEQERKDRHCR